MNLPAPSDAVRLRDLERQVSTLKAELHRLQRDTARRVDPAPVRLAVTCPDADATYPCAAGFPASVVPIKFLDVAFDPEPGALDLAETERSANVQAYAYSLHDRYLAEGTPVHVLWINRRWVIISRPSPALIGTTAALGSGDFTAGIAYPTMAAGFANDAAENYFAWDSVNGRLEVQQHGAGVWLFRWEQAARWVHGTLNTHVTLPADPDGDYEVEFVTTICTPTYVLTGGTAIAAISNSPTLIGAGFGATLRAPLICAWLFQLKEGDTLKFKVINTDTNGTLTTAAGQVCAIRTTYNNWLST